MTPLASQSHDKPRYERWSFKLQTWLIHKLIKAISCTLRVRYTGADHVPSSQFLLAVWHGELMFAPRAYFAQTQRPISAIISDHKDGEYLAQVLARFSIAGIRGSSSRGGAKAMINAIKAYKAGKNIAITPDGPRGPRHSVARGLGALAEKLDAPILVLTIRPERCWRLRTWDQFFIPKPFSQIEFIYHPPFKVTGMSAEAADTLIRDTMRAQALI